MDKRLSRRVLYRNDCARITGIAPRSWDWRVHHGHAPPPDKRIAGRPVWFPETIDKYLGDAA